MSAATEGAPRRGRPPVGEAIRVRVPADLLADLAAAAAADGVDRSTIIRRLVTEALTARARRAARRTR